MPNLNGLNLYLSMTLDGYTALQRLLDGGKKIDLILTLPKESAGKVADYCDFSPLSTRYQVPIEYINNINKLSSRFSSEPPNVMIVNGWSQIVSKSLIDACKNGCVGTHPALLPKNRGRAPIAWHFLNEETHGGITLYYLDEGCDSGPIIAQRQFKIKSSDNASTYYQIITDLGAELLLTHFNNIISGGAKNTATAQDNTRATYLLKRRSQDSFLDFRLPAQKVINLVRAVTSIYPLGYFQHESIPFYVKQAHIPAYAPKYSGLPGQIAKVTNTYIWVKTTDGMVELSNIVDDQGQAVTIMDTFQVGKVINE